MPTHYNQTLLQKCCIAGLFILVCLVGSPTGASQADGGHFGFIARQDVSGKALVGLNIHEMSDGEDSSRVFMVGPQRERLIMTLANSGRTGTRILTIVDDETGWWVSLSFAYGVEDLSLHEFLRRGDHVNAHMQLKTSTGLIFDVPDVPSSAHVIEVILRHLTASSVYDELRAEVPPRAAQLARTILQIESQFRPSQWGANIASDYLEMLAWSSKEDVETPQEDWTVENEVFVRGFAVSPDIRAFLAEFESTGVKEDPLNGGHVDGLFRKNNADAPSIRE